MIKFAQIVCLPAFAAGQASQCETSYFNQANCDEDEACGWDADLNMCSPVDVLCARSTNQASCDLNANCGWDAYIRICSPVDVLCGKPTRATEDLCIISHLSDASSNYGSCKCRWDGKCIAARTDGGAFDTDCVAACQANRVVTRSGCATCQTENGSTLGCL